MLLFVDGLDEGWESGEVTYWEKEALDYALPEGLSFAEQRLNRDLSCDPDILDESELNNDDLNFIHLATINGKKVHQQTTFKSVLQIICKSFDK